jgi:hypothetical protein
LSGLCFFRSGEILEGGEMADRKPSEPSPESVARANRQRLAQEEGARAMADVARDALAVRKNMERLRALRQAREAEQAASPQPALADAQSQRKKRTRKP